MSTAPEMKLGAISPWYGTKREMAPDICVELGPHISYFEPFCGSMSVLLAKPAVSHELVNDLHGDLINLARVLADPTAAVELYTRLQRVLYSEQLHLESQAVLVSSVPPADTDSANVDRAFHYFLANWIGRDGHAGTNRDNFQIAVRWTPGGGGGPTRFVGAVESIPAWHNRLRRVTILRRDAFEVISKVEDVDGVSMYVDPPYLMATRGGAGEHSRYLHEFDESPGGLYGGRDDHQKLADALDRFKRVRVVVSYYDDPRLAELYPKWTKRSLYRNKNLAVQNRRGSSSTTAPEVLLINGKSYGEVQ